jgi:hypothetical protein
LTLTGGSGASLTLVYSALVVIYSVGKIIPKVKTWVERTEAKIYYPMARRREAIDAKKKSLRLAVLTAFHSIPASCQ